MKTHPNRKKIFWRCVYKNRLTLLYMSCQEPIDYGTTLIKLMVNWLLAIINGNESVDLQWHFSHMGTYTGHLCPAAAWQIRYKSDIEAPLFNAWICVRYILISRWDDHHVGSFSLSYIWICRNRYLRLLRYEFRQFEICEQIRII